MSQISCKKLGQIDSNLTAALYRVPDKSLARPGGEQATATEDFHVHISYL